LTCRWSSCSFFRVFFHKCWYSIWVIWKRYFDDQVSQLSTMCKECILVIGRRSVPYWLIGKCIVYKYVEISEEYLYHLSVNQNLANLSEIFFTYFGIWIWLINCYCKYHYCYLLHDLRGVLWLDQSITRLESV